MACHGVDFQGYIAWNYLDFGPLGTDKELEGIALVCTGEVSVSIGYNQRDVSQATAGYTLTGDTLPDEGMVPFPFTAPSFQFRLTFSADQAWEWSALGAYFAGHPDPVPLTTVKGGITRLRTKGAALKDSLYDLLNGYVSAAKTVVVRPGTLRRAVLSSVTKGLVSFDGTLHTFASEVVALPEGYTLHVLTHPAGSNEDGTPIALSEIHFAKPLMGFLYVVAEFEDADFDTGYDTNVFHFWLQTGDVWEANKVYKLGAIVTPSTPNGFAYRATRLGAPNPPWTPNALRAEGDIVEPTVYNDFYFQVISVIGATPVSGATEPDWPTEDGAQVIEDSASKADGLVGAAEQPDPSASPAPATRDRYATPFAPPPELSS